jgi:hypothetical protein
MTGHALIKPSALALTMECQASVKLQAAVPEPPDTEEIAEGKAAHWVAMHWAAGKGADWEVGRKFEHGGRQWVVDIEMRNGARTYAMLGSESSPRLEDPVRISRIHSEHCWGTPDLWEFFPKGKHRPLTIDGITGEVIDAPIIRVADYKYGHKYVEVFGNWQLMAYGVGILERLQLTDEDAVFEFVLVQPRSFSRHGVIRVWRVPAVDLRAYVNQAWNQVQRALGDNPTAQTGAHCIDCRARHLCETFRAVSANLVDFSGRGELGSLDATALGQELRLLDTALQRLTARRTGLAAAAEASLHAGVRIPYYTLEPTKTRLIWKDGVTPGQVAATGDLFGIDLRKPAEVMTPRQAIDAGIPADIIEGNLAHRPQGSLQLKPISTKDAEKAFGVTRK